MLETTCERFPPPLFHVVFLRVTNLAESHGESFTCRASESDADEDRHVLPGAGESALEEDATYDSTFRVPMPR